MGRIPSVGQGWYLLIKPVEVIHYPVTVRHPEGAAECAIHNRQSEVRLSLSQSQGACKVPKTLTLETIRRTVE